MRTAAIRTFGEACAKCHVLDGAGGDIGPDLTHVGRRLDEAAIARQIENPTAANPESDMPVFKGKLTADEIGALARYLASRR